MKGEGPVCAGKPREKTFATLTQPLRHDPVYGQDTESRRND